MRTLPLCGENTMPELPEPETPFILLTQDDCPRCERLKAMLERPLRGHYRHAITSVHRQEQPELFYDRAETYGVRSTPVIIRLANGEVLRDVDSLSAVSAFLNRPPI